MFEIDVCLLKFDAILLKLPGVLSIWCMLLWQLGTVLSKLPRVLSTSCVLLCQLGGVLLMLPGVLSRWNKNTLCREFYVRDASFNFYHSTFSIDKLMNLKRKGISK